LLVGQIRRVFSLLLRVLFSIDNELVGDQCAFEAPRDGWLLVTDRWASGWVARVNDRPVLVEGGDFLFRALPVRAGSNRIALTCEPPGHPWLPVLIWMFIAAVLAASWWPLSLWGSRTNSRGARSAGITSGECDAEARNL
jgi:hypothetical protein